MRARDYDPATGRFTADDPVAIPAGMPYAAGYSYAFNNPLTGTDPTGRWVNDCGFFSAMCDSAVVFGNELVGAKNAAVGIVVGIGTLVTNPGEAINGVVNACTVSSDPIYRVLKCIDNLNPIARIRDQAVTGFTSNNLEQAGQATGAALFNSALISTPFAKAPVSAFANCAPVRIGAGATNAADTLLPGLPASAPKPLGLGSTGRTAPRNLTEQLAMTEVRSAPAGTQLQRITMTDPRWPAGDGWVKMQQVVNGATIHYVRNIMTGAVDDFKFVRP